MAGHRSVHLVDRGARDAEPLLFVHCWGVSTDGFAAFFDRLAAHYRVIAPDLPGFGRSRVSGTAVSYSAYADVLADVLADLGIERAHVAGLSMGGGVALTFAARYPQRVRTLVLMAPTGCPDVSLPRLACNRLLELAEQALRPAQLQGKGPAARSFAVNLLRHPATLAATLRMLASRSILDEAHQVSAPTLLLWGGRDRTIPPRLAGRFIDHLPGAVLQIMPEGFHEMASGRPEETARIMHDFIAQAQAERASAGAATP